MPEKLPWTALAQKLGNERKPNDYARHWPRLRQKLINNAVLKDMLDMDFSDDNESVNSNNHNNENYSDNDNDNENGYGNQIEKSKVFELKNSTNINEIHFEKKIKSNSNSQTNEQIIITNFAIPNNEFLIKKNRLKDTEYQQNSMTDYELISYLRTRYVVD